MLLSTNFAVSTFKKKKKRFGTLGNSPEGGGGGGEVTWVNFCCVCAAGLSEPLSHYSLFSGQL